MSRNETEIILGDSSVENFVIENKPANLGDPAIHAINCSHTNKKMDNESDSDSELFRTNPDDPDQDDMEYIRAKSYIKGPQSNPPNTDLKKKPANDIG